MTIDEIRNLIDNFDLEIFYDDIDSYEEGIRLLVEEKDYAYAFKGIKAVVEPFLEYANKPFTSYQLGMDYKYSYYCLLKYAEFYEKGIEGIVEKDQEKADLAYIQLLKRVDDLADEQIEYLLPHMQLLYKCAYPDINDRYLQALRRIAYFYKYEKGDYKKAFKFHKKAADFKIEGRQIVAPYYLQATHQCAVANMYREGKGVKQDFEKATHYYKLCSDNTGRKCHPMLTEHYVDKGEFDTAFLCLTENNPRFPYDQQFMYPANQFKLADRIFEGLLAKENRDDFEETILGLAYILGVGTKKDEEKGWSLVKPKYKKFAKAWAKDFRPLEACIVL